MFSSTSSRGRHLLRGSLMPLVVVCCGLSLMATLSGCSGCNKKQTAAAKKKKEDEKKKKEKPKDPFEVSRLYLQPNDPSIAQNTVKPGHWISASQMVKANHYKLLAELQSSSADRIGTPLEVERTPFRMTMTRPAALPKGQEMHLEMLFFVPRDTGRQSKVVWLRTRLLGRRGGREVDGGSRPTTRMPAYQFHFVVLSRFPDEYGYLPRLDTIVPPSAELGEEHDVVYYRVVLPKINQRVPLPSQPLAWSSIAYILWDELNPNLLTLDQQDALLDWLHWGGQLLVSGPGSLDRLRGSFLEPYLPAEATRSVQLQQRDFDQLNQHWSLVDQKRKVHKSLNVVEGQPLVGVELELRPGATYLPGVGKLVAERRVGGGRVVLTAFSLADRRVVNWGSFDSFFNGALLRRPRRMFSKDQYGEPKMVFSDFRAMGVKDPRMMSTLRYFSRDLGAKEDSIGLTPDTDDWHFKGYTAAAQSGVGGWDDFSATANAARDSLKEAAGISIPKAEFVVQVIAIYLIFLVPINWGLFRLMGRVEWAWVAAPLIAVIGSVAVVRLAQLDIGFARSRTEAAVLEIQGGYRRAHLTRFTALYTSLSTKYDLLFEDMSALAQPFATSPSYTRRLHDTITHVNLRRDNQVTLSGFRVASNSTGMVHSEQMYNLGGTVSLAGDQRRGWQLNNDTELTFQDVAVLRRTDAGSAEVAWVGQLGPQRASPLSFRSAPDRLRVPQWNQSAAMSPAKAGRGEVSLRGLLDLAVEGLRLSPGEVRMIGWTDQELKGLTIRPQAAQSVLRTLVLVHLQRGTLSKPLPDSNLKSDVVDEPRRDRGDTDEPPDNGPEPATGPVP